MSNLSNDDPFPRDLRDHLLELTAAIETLRVAIGAIASESGRRSEIIAFYDEGVSVLEAVSNGKDHPDRYLDLLREHISKTRNFLSV